MTAAAPDTSAIPQGHDLLCFSHLRWDFVFQRPQHLLGRFARERRVYYVEEPFFHAGAPYLAINPRSDGLRVVVPHLPGGVDQVAAEELQRALLDRMIADEGIDRPIAWFYTPMAMGFADHMRPIATVYDCMDELREFAFAPPELAEREQQLFRRADLVFTGGHSLYEAKRHQHHDVHAFPSGIDRAHFARAREPLPDPDDQAAIPRPRLGWFGVIDERLDLELLAGIADARPDWQIVMIGPVVKIDPASLPRRANIHWLGQRNYDELPAYLAGWDAAILPFARNAATRYISPTKTPEYLAAGKPVVSTSIRDVVRPYGESGLVGIADTPDTFVAAVLAAQANRDEGWLAQVDAHLAGCSWDDTWRRMHGLVARAVGARAARSRRVAEAPGLASLGGA